MFSKYHISGGSGTKKFGISDVSSLYVYCLFSLSEEAKNVVLCSHRLRLLCLQQAWES